MIRIHDLSKKVKTFFEENRQDLYIATIIFLVGMASFGLGRLSVSWPKKESITITNGELQMPNGKKAKNNKNPSLGVGSASSSSKGRYVASKSGTAYHYPWCPGALKIKEENKIWFQTKEEAESRGLKPAGNCEGL